MQIPMIELTYQSTAAGTPLINFNTYNNIQYRLLVSTYTYNDSIL